MHAIGGGVGAVVDQAVRGVGEAGRQHPDRGRGRGGPQDLVALRRLRRPPLDVDAVLRGDEYAVVGRLWVGARAGADHDAGLHPRPAGVGLGHHPGADGPVTVRRVGRVLREALVGEAEVVVVRPDVRAATLDGPGARGAAALLRADVNLVARQDVGPDVGTGEAGRADAGRLRG